MTASGPRGMSSDTGDRVKISVVLLVCLMLGGCQTLSKSAGNGPIKLSRPAAQAFDHYLANDPLVFAVTEDGRGVYYHRCIEVGCDHHRVVATTIAKCTARYDRACKLFAIRKEIVWQNPGNWRPTGSETTASSQNRIAARIRTALSIEAAYWRYRKAPGHKALVAMAPGTNGRIAHWGVSYGHASPEDALRVAQQFCVGATGGPRYIGCRIVELNGQTMWPMHKDELSQARLIELADIGERMPAYSGTRPLTLTWDGENAWTTEMSYEMRVGRIEFTFQRTETDTFCTGEAVLVDGSGGLQFQFRCSNGKAVSGTGTVSATGSTASLKGHDASGAAIDLAVGPDPVLFP